MHKLKIHNGRVVTAGGIIPNGAVWIKDGKIDAVGKDDGEVSGWELIDAEGNYISPGFIDIHVHGGGGYDFMDGTEEAFLKIAALHARYGTTAMVPTTLTADTEGILQTLALYEKADRHNKQGARFLGMHLEGPYFAMNQRGAQDPRYIRNPDPREYTDILERSNVVRRWSAAPELPGAIAFGEYLCSRGILPAIAHTDAVYEDVVEAYENGYSLVTHLYSGMSGVTRRNAYRYAGVVESAFVIDGLDVEVIADGVHLPPVLLQLVYKIKGPDKIALITDAMRAAGTAGGESVLGNLYTGLKVIVEDGVAKLPDRSAFAGSVATADRLVRTMVHKAGIPLAEAVRMMTLTPARIMGVSDEKGSLAPGKDADIVLFDDNITIAKTIIGGDIIYSKSPDAAIKVDLP
jgi:N-acetylglucosamine-6-phosphate deacetylase